MSIQRLITKFPIQNFVSRILCGRCHYNFLSTKQPKLQVINQINPDTGEPVRKKTSIIPKITLLSGENISVTTLEEAKKLSKRRDLKLVKIVDVDSKTQRPVYKLMSGTDYLHEDLKQKEQKKKDKQSNATKGEKVVFISSVISLHDLQTQTNKIQKWLDKMLEVRVVINGDSANMELSEKIYSTLEDLLKGNGRFLQKRTKGSDIKFNIVPPKKDNDGNPQL